MLKIYITEVQTVGKRTVNDRMIGSSQYDVWAWVTNNVCGPPAQKQNHADVNSRQNTEYINAHLLDIQCDVHSTQNVWCSLLITIRMLLIIEYFEFTFSSDSRHKSIKYEGRSINKLQNVVILLIFKMWKFGNIRFIGDFILNTSCEFY